MYIQKYSKICMWKEVVIIYNLSERVTLRTSQTILNECCVCVCLHTDTLKTDKHVWTSEVVALDKI